MRHSAASDVLLCSSTHFLMMMMPKGEDKQDSSSLSEFKDILPLRLYYTITCRFSWKTLTMECRAPEQDVHVSPETVAELLRVWMLMLELVVMVGESGALKT